MVYAYLSSTSTPVAALSVGLSCTIAGMRGLLGTVKGAFMPSPQKPKRMYLKFLILCGLLTQCSNAYSQSGKSEDTSRPRLTTSSMTCTGLQRRAHQWYSDNHCSFTRVSNGPAVFAGTYECRFKAQTLLVFSLTPVVEYPGYCKLGEDTCTQDGWTVNVAWYRARLDDEFSCVAI